MEARAADSGRGEKLWEPSAEVVERSNMTRYMRWLEAERGVRLDGDYQALWRWSVENLDDFWRSIWDHLGVRASTEPTAVLGRRSMPGAEWFPGAELNYAEHLFRGKSDSALAIQHAAEGG